MLIGLGKLQVMDFVLFFVVVREHVYPSPLPQPSPRAQCEARVLWATVFWWFGLFLFLNILPTCLVGTLFHWPIANCFISMTLLIMVNFCSISGNANLHKRNKSSRTGIIIGSIGAVLLLIATILSCWFLRKGKNSKKRYTDQGLRLNTLRTLFPILIAGCNVVCITFYFQPALVMFCSHRSYLLPWKALQQKLLIASLLKNWKKQQRNLREKLALEVMG